MSRIASSESAGGASVGQVSRISRAISWNARPPASCARRGRGRSGRSGRCMMVSHRRGLARRLRRRRAARHSHADTETRSQSARAGLAGMVNRLAMSERCGCPARSASRRERRGVAPIESRIWTRLGNRSAARGKAVSRSASLPSDCVRRAARSRLTASSLRIALAIQARSRRRSDRVRRWRRKTQCAHRRTRLHRTTCREPARSSRQSVAASSPQLIHELAEQIGAVLRPRARLGMILHAERRPVGQLQPAEAAVEQADMGRAGIGGQAVAPRPRSRGSCW